MSVLGIWTGGVDAAVNIPEAWTAPNGLFPTQQRNDASAYTFSSALSRLTLPSSGLANGYLIVAMFEFEDTSNGRFNPQGRFIQNSGTGNFVSAQTGGYSRDNSEDRAYVKVWSIVDGPSASSTFDFQWKADSDDAAVGDGTVRSRLSVTPLFYDDIALYTSTSAALYGGTTPNQVTGFTGVDGNDITISGDVVTCSADNARYLAIGSQFYEGRGGRTQRWIGLEFDGTLENASKACVYYRNGSNDENGGFYSWPFETVTADVDIESVCYRGDGNANGQGGANTDGSTPGVGAHALVVMQLTDSTEIMRTTGTGGQNIATPVPVDLSLFEVADIDFSDAGSFVRASDIAVEAQQDMDCLFGANISCAQNNVAATQRLTAFAEPVVDGVEDTSIFHGNYQRNNQGSTDTFGWSANLLDVVALSNLEDLGISVTELPGSEGGGGNVSVPSGWEGFWAINLDTMEGGGISPIAGSASLLVTPSGTLDGNGELQGLSALAFTESANISGIGGLDGSAPLNFALSASIAGVLAATGLVPMTIGASGDLAADGELVGSAPIALSPQGSLVGRGPLAGSLPLVFGVAGNMHARAAIIGSASLDLTAIANIEARGLLAGNSTLSLSPAGLLLGVGDLAGSAGVVIFPTATLDANGSLVGNASLLFDAVGDIVSSGSNAISGSVDLSISANADLVARGGLAGSAAVVFLPSATAAARGDLSGVVDLVFAVAGTMQSDGLLSGSLLLTISPSAGLVAIGDLQGTSPLVFDATGTMLSDGALAGSVPLQVTAQALIVAAGELAGQADVLFAAAGDIAGVGPLSGQSNLVFGVSGSLDANGALTGAVPLTLLPLATLSGGSGISGTVPLTFVHAGILQAFGALDGVAALSFVGIGSLTAYASISGSVDLVFDVAGSLGSDAQITGSSNLLFSGSGTVIGRADIEGQSLLTFAAAGGVDGRGNLDGSLTMTFTPTASSAAVATLIGSAAFQFTLDGAIFDSAGRRWFNGNQSIDTIPGFNSSSDLSTQLVNSFQSVTVTVLT